MALDAGADLADRVRRRLLAQGPHPTPSSVAAAMRADGVLLGPETLLDRAHELHGALAGAGPLEPFLQDPAVTDVLVTAPDRVWVDRGRGAELVPGVSFTDDAAVRRLAQRLAAAAGRRLDDAQPWVDARLGDGTRVHAVLHPVSVSGTCLSLRVRRRQGFTLDDLVALGALPADVRPWIDAVVRARLAFLLTGGTGTGKTAWLGALLDRVDPSERIVLVEDSAELAPAHPHVVRLEARPANLEGAGAVTLRDLVRQSLRMRPDRVVVGEVRGAEVVDLLAALNTGHEGGAATVHANSAESLPARLEALGLAAGLDRAAVHAQLAAGVDVVLHLTRDRSGVRRWASLSVAERVDGWTTVVPALARDGDSAVAGPGMAALRRRLADHAPATGGPW